jgi:rod shape-determining protein MreB and related proteins
MDRASFTAEWWQRAVTTWQGVRLLFAADLAIDLGSANTRIFVRGRGVELNEPSIVALREHDQRLLAAGRTAKLMIGRVPASVSLVRPVRNSVIAEVEAAAKMLMVFLHRARAQPTLRAPRLLFCLPAKTTLVERRALEEVARSVGARQVQFIEEPVAAAFGLGIETEAAPTSTIVDIGAETVDIAVLSLGGLVHAATYRTGGRAMDRALINHLRKQHSLEIGEETAERLKRALGSTAPHQRDRSLEAGGRNLKTQMPMQVNVTSAEIQTALEPVVAEIARAVCTALAELSPEIAADLLKTGLEMRLASNPTLAAVTGAARICSTEENPAEPWTMLPPLIPSEPTTPE